MKLTSTLLMTLALAAKLPFSAIATGDMSKTDAMGNRKSSGFATLSDGEVKKIDKEAGKITIKHGPLVNLGMPGMTMAFRVKDSAMQGGRCADGYDDQAGE